MHAYCNLISRLDLIPISHKVLKYFDSVKTREGMVFYFELIGLLDFRKIKYFYIKVTKHGLFKAFWKKERGVQSHNRQPGDNREG